MLNYLDGDEAINPGTAIHEKIAAALKPYEPDAVPIMPMLMDDHVGALGRKIRDHSGLILTNAQVVDVYKALREWTAVKP